MVVVVGRAGRVEEDETAALHVVGVLPVAAAGAQVVVPDDVVPASRRNAGGRPLSGVVHRDNCAGRGIGTSEREDSHGDDRVAVAVGREDDRIRVGRLSAGHAPGVEVGLGELAGGSAVDDEDGDVGRRGDGRDLREGDADGERNVERAAEADGRRGSAVGRDGDGGGNGIHAGEAVCDDRAGEQVERHGLRHGKGHRALGTQIESPASDQLERPGAANRPAKRMIGAVDEEVCGRRTFRIKPEAAIVGREKRPACRFVAKRGAGLQDDSLWIECRRRFAERLRRGPDGAVACVVGRANLDILADDPRAGVGGRLVRIEEDRALLRTVPRKLDGACVAAGEDKVEVGVVVEFHQEVEGVFRRRVNGGVAGEANRSVLRRAE